MDDPSTDFVTLFKALQKYVYTTAVEKGWWLGEQNRAEKIALMHSELSEALEYLRNGDGPSDHIFYQHAASCMSGEPLGRTDVPFKGVEEEFADVIIRIMDYAEHFGLRVAEAVIAKALYNRGREFKHGGKEF